MAVITTSNSADPWHPDVVAVPANDAVPDALALAIGTQAGTVEGDAEAVKVPWVDDAPATVVAEGATIDESDPGLAETVVYTHKVAQLTRLSREQFGQPNTNQLMTDSVRRAVTMEGNVRLLTQPAPAAGAIGPTGLLNTPGLTEGPAVTGNLDALVDLQATLAELNGVPSHLLVSPSAWASLRKLKRATGSAESLLGVGADDAAPYLVDLPVIVSPAMPTGQGLMLSKTDIATAIGQVIIAQSEHAYFASDSIAVRATWRFGASPVHPERHGKFTVTPPAAE